MKKEAVKNQALGLRKSGKSYKEIANLLAISKSTISAWFKDINWSQDIKNQLIEKSKESSRKRLTHLNIERRNALDKHYAQAEQEAIKEFVDLKKETLFITAISLYWGEGDKIFKNGIVRISNVDEKVLKVFNDFLQKVCNVSVENIRAGMLLYPDLNSEKCLEFWSKEIKIAKDRFFKSTVIKGRHKTRKLGYGVCIVSVHSKYLKKKILVYCSCYSF